MAMKKYILTFLVVMPILMSCTDYLGIKPRGYDVPSRLEHYEGLLYGPEYYLIKDVFTFMSFEFTTDKDGFANAYTELGPASCNAYRWQSDLFLEDEDCNEWIGPSSFLYSTNLVIEEVLDAEDGTEESRRAVWAEAKMMRAWHHFLMAQFFGKPYDPATASSDPCIPIITKARTTGVEFPLHTVQEVYDFIISEMTEAVPYLKDAPEHFKRVFKATGNAMLGKVLWMKGDWESAFPYLETAMQCVKADPSTALMDYASMLDEKSVLVYPTDDLLNTELLFSYSSMPRLWMCVYPTYYSKILFAIKSDVLLRFFTTKDARLSTMSGLNSGKSAMLSLKASDYYYPELTKMNSELGVSVPDLYLIYAECAARLGKVGECAEALLELRSNRLVEGYEAIPSSVVSAQDYVRFAVEERFRENIGYGVLWFDMRRLWNDPAFQDLKDMYVHTDGVNDYKLTEDRLVMNIPPSVLAWHPEYK